MYIIPDRLNCAVWSDANYSKFLLEPKVLLCLHAVTLLMTIQNALWTLYSLKLFQRLAYHFNSGYHWKYQETNAVAAIKKLSKQWINLILYK